MISFARNLYYNAMLDYQLCSKNMTQRECKSASWKQKIVIETTHGPVHVLVHVLGLGQAHHSLNLFLILVPSSFEKPCFQNSTRQTVE